MRILREEGSSFAEAAEDKPRDGKQVEDAIKRIAAPYGFRSAVRGFRSTEPCKVDFTEFRRRVEEFVNSGR
jgi:hypothetical protein